MLRLMTLRGHRIIAILLGRLELSIEDALAAYENLSRKIFRAKKFEKYVRLAISRGLKRDDERYGFGARYSSRNLRKQIRKYLISKGYEPDAPMKPNTQLRGDGSLRCRV